MSNEDNEFFILVLGVLAAIILVISWWFTAGGTGFTPTTAATVSATDSATSTSDGAADDAHSSSASGDDVSTPSDDAQSGDEDDEAAGEASDTAATTNDESTAEESTPIEAAPGAATVFDAIAGDERLSVLTDLLRDAGLDAVLAGDGPFTVFAPTNDAISAAAASDTTISVIESARTAVLEYHVVPGTYTVEDLTDLARGSRSNELATVQGELLDISRQAGTIALNANVVLSGESLSTGNGVVHLIDNVLVPPVAALNTVVDLEPILFASGSAQLDPRSFATLDRLIEVLGTGAVSITVEGHTDNSGDPLLNQNLSQSRARSVVNYLVANGIDEGRLEAKGFGSENPVADNETEEGRALNRRIDFTLG